MTKPVNNTVGVSPNDPVQLLTPKEKVSPDVQAKRCTITRLFKVAALGMLVFTAGALYGASRCIQEPVDRDACNFATCFTKDPSLPFYKYDLENPLLRPRTTLEKSLAETTSPKGGEKPQQRNTRISEEFKKTYVRREFKPGVIEPFNLG